MSTAHAYLPARPYAQRGRTLNPPLLALLSIAVAICCAAIVFATLYNLDQQYPVAAVRTEPVRVAEPLAAPAASSAAVVPGASGATTTSPAEQDSIARTHSELLALERLGKRTYVEFSVARSNTFQPVGPLKIGLWRTDTKRAYAQISVLLDRHRSDFRHVSANEPISVPRAHSEPLQLVINDINRNHITGYLSEPKND